MPAARRLWQRPDPAWLWQHQFMQGVLRPGTLPHLLVPRLLPMQPWPPKTTRPCSMAPTDLDPSAGSENADMSAAGAQQPSQRITPYMSKARPASTTQHHTPASGGKFAERQDAGSVLTSLNTHLEVPAEGEAMEVDGPLGAVALQRCAVEVLGNPLAAGVKYMVDRLEDKVGAVHTRGQKERSG